MPQERSPFPPFIPSILRSSHSSPCYSEDKEVLFWGTASQTNELISISSFALIIFFKQGSFEGHFLGWPLNNCLYNIHNKINEQQ